ncbi:MAG: DNA-binding protein [Chloroflexi bacterium RBG_16_56_8]|nr:MAG: DNA-binding protein [Chloroflexi bacterium RBG_16_56_8]
MDEPRDQRESDLPKLASPARRALAGAGISRIEQLTELSEAQISQLHGVGPNAINQLRRALAARGLSFAGGYVGAQRSQKGS